ncbi:50S ribosomal protein L9 [Pseudorhodoplanes sp.]|uniref:50S ribosomal protein L9 n=1 Tax=Pseudorhodoplanes sp. TaxID=1934341 RepID=UPI002CE0AB46|nr:50S ribosomal protein L9 [Pseudorhodoplanes sp.]HWV52261.1 50S ribosomal protein L9 [Pseudorhodoplanes sp.]
MEVILLERVAKLGQMGETVRVKDGFARNFLLPKGKALRATKANKERFEGMRKELEAKNLENRSEAQKIADKLNGQSFVALRQASESGQLYGSVSARDIADLVTEGGFSISRSQVALNAPIKTIGQHRVEVSLHPEVEVNVSIIVARNAEEAERVKRGEDVTVRRDEADEEQEAAAAEGFFDPEARHSDEEADEEAADKA